MKVEAALRLCNCSTASNEDGMAEAVVAVRARRVRRWVNCMLINWGLTVTEGRVISEESGYGRELSKEYQVIHMK